MIVHRHPHFVGATSNYQRATFRRVRAGMRDEMRGMGIQVDVQGMKDLTRAAVHGVSYSVGFTLGAALGRVGKAADSITRARRSRRIERIKEAREEAFRSSIERDRARVASESVLVGEMRVPVGDGWELVIGPEGERMEFVNESSGAAGSEK